MIKYMHLLLVNKCFFYLYIYIQLEREEVKTLDTIESGLNKTNNVVSKKKLRKKNRFTVDELKELALVPQVVEVMQMCKLRKNGYK